MARSKPCHYEKKRMIAIRNGYEYIFGNPLDRLNMPEFSKPFFPNLLACVIFDIDGTLARSNDLIFASFNHIAGKYLGKELARSEIVALFGPPEDGGLKKILDREEVEEAMEDLCTYYEQNHAGSVSLHTGVLDVLTFLTGRQIPLAAFTGKGRRTATFTLDRLGILPYFRIVVSGSDVQRHKPDPEGISLIIDRLGIPAKQTLMVGDSVSDVKAAHAAGVPVASVLWDSLDPQAVLDASPDFRFYHPHELLEWLRRQFTS